MLEWNPNVGVSLFLFGDRIAPYLSAIGLEEFLDEYNETLSWEVYGWSKPELRILVEDDKIVSVACYDECWYRGINLIGADIATAMECIGAHPEDNPDEFDLDDGIQAVFEFDEVGAQLWVKKGIVVTGICGFLPEEENPGSVVNGG